MTGFGTAPVLAQSPLIKNIVDRMGSGTIHVYGLGRWVLYNENVTFSIKCNVGGLCQNEEGGVR